MNALKYPSLVGDYEYLFIQCSECNDKAKVVKNKGADNWSPRNEQIRDFLLMHSGCKAKSISLKWDSPIF